MPDGWVPLYDLICTHLKARCFNPVVTGFRQAVAENGTNVILSLDRCPACGQPIVCLEITTSGFMFLTQCHSTLGTRSHKRDRRQAFWKNIDGIQHLFTSLSTLEQVDEWLGDVFDRFDQSITPGEEPTYYGGKTWNELSREEQRDWIREHGGWPFNRWV